MIRTGPNLRIRLDQFFSAISVTSAFVSAVCEKRLGPIIHVHGRERFLLVTLSYITEFWHRITFGSFSRKLYIPKPCRYDSAITATLPHVVTNTERFFELNRVESSYGVPLRQIHRMHGMARSSLAAHYSLPKSSLANVELIQPLLTVKL